MLASARTGREVMRLFLAVPGVKVTAICDIDEELATVAASDVVSAGQPEPALYTDGEQDYEQLVKRDDVDLVLVMTPWDWHFPMAMAAMDEGKHVAVETPLATEVRHLWELVDKSERTGRHCLMLENVAYGQNELRLLRLVHDGRFGELLHGSGGYCHDLRASLFQWTATLRVAAQIADASNRRHLLSARARPDLRRVRHQSWGPLTMMVCATTPARTLAKYRADNVAAGSSVWDESYVTGDRTISLLETVNGKVVRIESTLTEAMPLHPLDERLSTLGAFEDDPPRISSPRK